MDVSKFAMTVNVISLALHLGCFIWLKKTIKLKIILSENYDFDQEDRLPLTEDQRKRWLEIYGHPLLIRTKKFARIASQLQENNDYLEKYVFPINNIDEFSSESTHMDDSAARSIAESLERDEPIDHIIISEKKMPAENLSQTE